MTYSTSTVTRRAGGHDRYLMRGMLHCGLCESLLMVPVLTSDGVRHYGCPSRQCPRPLLPAEPIEQFVWGHLVALNEMLAGAVPDEDRRVVVRELLRSVQVAEEPGDLYYRWRD